MPIIRQVVGTRRRKLGESDKKHDLKDVQARDEACYKVRFRNIEQPGERITAFYRGHGRTIYHIELEDGEECELPLGYIMEVRKNCKSVGKVSVTPKTTGEIMPTSDAGALNMQQFDPTATRTSGRYDPKPTNLYVLEFVDKDLEHMERIWAMLESPSSSKRGKRA